MGTLPEYIRCLETAPNAHAIQTAAETSMLSCYQTLAAAKRVLQQSQWHSVVSTITTAHTSSATVQRKLSQLAHRASVLARQLEAFQEMSTGAQGESLPAICKHRTFDPTLV